MDRRPTAVAANILLDVRKHYVRTVLEPDRIPLEHIPAEMWPSAPSAEHEALDAFGPSLRRAHDRLATAVDRGKITATSAAVVWRTRVQQHDDAEVAAELGVDVNRIRGTGSEGAITREDIERAAARQAPSEPGPTGVPATPITSAAPPALPAPTSPGRIAGAGARPLGGVAAGAKG